MPRLARTGLRWPSGGAFLVPLWVRSVLIALVVVLLVLALATMIPKATRPTLEPASAGTVSQSAHRPTAD